jgi:hypothetical protein
MHLWRSQWPRGLRRRSAAACMLRLWVGIPTVHGCLLWVLCVDRERLQRADHLSRGFLSIVVHRYVWLRTVVNDEAMASVGPQNQRKKNLIRWVGEWIRAFLFWLFVNFANRFWRRGPPRTNTSRISSLILRSFFCADTNAMLRPVLQVTCFLLCQILPTGRVIPYNFLRFSTPRCLCNLTTASERAHTNTHAHVHARTHIYILYI